MGTVNGGSIAGPKSQYDAQVRKLLAEKALLARVLLRTMGEFKGMSADEVEACIEGDPEVAGVPVDPGLTNARVAGGGEDAVPDEGTVSFDIRTYVNVPGEGGPVRVIVNVEAQRRFNPGYQIVTRGVFYAARLISSQLGVEFDHSRYDDVRKVYSIWICMNAPAGIGNAISSYAFAKQDLFGSMPDRPWAYDKAEVVVVALGGGENSGDEFIDMMNLLLAPGISKEDKKDGLKDRYNIEVRGDLEEGVDIMCNLSEGVAEWELERRNTELVVENRRRGLSYEDIARFLGLTVAKVKELEQKALAPA